MKLVTITLLLFVHTADLTSNNCDGVKDQVVFCAAGSSLKIEAPDTGYAWHFGTANVAVDSALSIDTSTKELTGTLAAKHTGVYLATKDSSPTDKFTIIVDAVTCTKNEECQVGTGSSIHLNSDLGNGVSWTLADEPIGDPGNDDAPKFTAEKKELGLFNVKKTQSGKYKATLSPSSVEFPVTVSDKTPVSMASVKKGVGVGCDATLECEVTGDAKTIEWTKDGTKLTPKGKTLTVDKQAASARYVCKVQGYHGGAAVTSAPFPYTYAVSTVSITQNARVLTCVADGAVKSWEWLTFGNMPVSASDGTVDSDPSKFNLASGAKGQFSCKVTDCQGNTKSSQFLPVGGNVDPTGTPTGAGGATTPGAATQGTSCSVALLVISVLIELYVVMMM
ncbi:uncharacterized protein [Syngnathus scovelli]|uniref:uncharacterized protein n=1 Tax=Syngnathus scovelli TaxID=161590 RepID=UPI002110DEF2|nr:uncharacterized protein LOC125991420 [Syngnathus scovelli]XP_049615278.1 uncharacterized protein LOC125991420 [Syngnathus scovelli]XP_049615289.1 uncharacterized protein LOC125991420 [Syngnathus scovelli]XP_049615299.1 uncharacterized protein LOC125991420 [Syngnathus scovelli]XP_049615308.1 uncharacterized protein LOC125991420 [Syngnathus scovelli]